MNGFFMIIGQWTRRNGTRLSRTKVSETMNDLDSPVTGPGPADPMKVKDFWLDVVRPAADLGKLEKIPTVKGTSTRGRDIARKQNHALTRKVIGGFGSNYDLIDWSH